MKGILKYLIFIIPLSLIKCQKQELKPNCVNKEFYFQDSLMFFKGNPFHAKYKIEDYIKVFGSYSRMEENTNGNSRRTYYYFKNDVVGIVDQRDVSVLIIDPNQSNEKNNYQKLEEVINTYGNYDSLREENIRSKTEKYYVWDKLGVSAWATNDSIHSLKIHFTSNGVNSFLLNQNIESLEYKENTQKEKMTWVPYSGEICFNGKIIIVGMNNPDNWNSSIRKMGISGQEFDPGGDSKESIRRIKNFYNGSELIIDIIKETLSESEGGEDVISRIDISW